MATLELVNLSKRFGAVTAVDTLNLHVADGEFMCILGPSGCGKSTLLRMVAGFETPSAGEILIGGERVTTQAANRRPTAMVFQKYTLWPHMNVFANIAFGLQLRKMPKHAIQRKVEEALALVGLSGYEERYPAQLSGGQQQRVALARALVLEPKILLLDEPFSSLDAILRVRLREELRRIQRRLKITAIFVTHDQEEALTLADRIAVMSEGRVEQLDSPAQIYANPRTLFVADFIGAMNLLEGELREGRLYVSGLTISGLAALKQLNPGPVTVAIRPEDLAVLPGAHQEAWHTSVEQISDLGHYRRALLEVNGGSSLPPIKMYLPKSLAPGEGSTLFAYPRRLLIYQNHAAPVEIVRELPAEALTLTI